MTTLREHRMLSFYAMGKRDQKEGKPELVPVYADEHETVAYQAGYRIGGRQEERRKRLQGEVIDPQLMTYNEAVDLAESLGKDYIVRLAVPLDKPAPALRRYRVWCCASDHWVER